MLRAEGGRFGRVIAGLFLGLGLVNTGEGSEGMKRVEDAFFALERRGLVVELETFPSLFDEAFRRGNAFESNSSSFASRDILPVTGELGAAEPPGSPAVKFAPTRFQTGQKIEVPAGFCRTRQCRTFVVVGAAVVGGGVALIAAGGEGNRKLGTAVALAGCALIVVVLLID
jgi:hypothetical protein